MGEQVAQIIGIMVLIIAVVAVVALGFGMFTTSKKQANGTQNELVTQLDSISKAVYTDLDQKVVSGIRLKSVVDQVKTADCAVLIGTLGLFGAQLNLMGDYVKETGVYTPVTGGTNQTILNGQLTLDLKAGKVPMARLEGMNTKTSLDTTVTSPYVVNYGTILKNSVMGVTGDAILPTAKMGTGTTDLTMAVATPPKGYNDTSAGGFNQTIRFTDGQFITKLDYLTDDNSQVLRYDSVSDLDKAGQTMSVSDTSNYNSYVLKSADGNYKGLVFLQRRK